MLQDALCSLKTGNFFFYERNHTKQPFDAMQRVHIYIIITRESVSKVSHESTRLLWGIFMSILYECVCVRVYKTF